MRTPFFGIRSVVALLLCFGWGCSALVDATLEGDDPPTLSCEGEPNETRCGDGRICVDEVCVTTRCGDGFVATDEQCDDANSTEGDGCDADCTFSCEMDETCDDGEPCNGAETCDVSTHTCTVPVPIDGMACEFGAEEGVCRGGICADVDCGDGTIDPGEDCDDENFVSGDGCEGDCTFSCAGDEECANDNPCDGADVCNLDTHRCDDTPLDCDDDEVCTEDLCDPKVEGNCVHELINDDDGDGVSEEAECTDPALAGDCDDMDDSVFPGARELCDGFDNDCNDVVDDEVTTVTCLRDSDGDRFGVRTGALEERCSCPDGYVVESSQVDCDDENGSVFPGQRGFFTVPRSERCIGDGCFDYDCDERDERRYTNVGNCRLSGSVCVGSGWSREVPGCGVEAEWLDCESRPRVSCALSRVVVMRTQSCQ